MKSESEIVRERFEITGVVQGVGFRPFVYRLATRLGLVGYVRNDVAGVIAEVEGTSASLREFHEHLRVDAPPRALITDVRTEPLTPRGDRAFEIVASASSGVGTTEVGPDIATCDSCLRELFDRADRRFRHPFITCTDCGPRFTITTTLPYDRPNTTMAEFTMCEACALEYEDPFDRRYHAQPICCPDCGPHLAHVRVDGTLTKGDEPAIAAAVSDLRDGQIVAVKGVGGYHLACRADLDDPLVLLRWRKARSAKPFALMARDLGVVRRIAQTDAEERRILSGPARPIVLLHRRQGAAVSDLVAPGSPHLGVMLPSTPLHHLLLADGPDLVVMTSGNVSSEPIAFEDEEARSRLLGRLADAVLAHDRAVHVPCDDSVVRVFGGVEMPIRRSRGYAPLPIRLPVKVDPLLAVGGELKNTSCVAAGDRAWLSQHLGDMENLETLHALDRSVEQMCRIHGVVPSVVVADEHPGYLTRRWATARTEPTLTVQHHRAHIASVLAENGVGPDVRVTGVALDGTGYGDDGTIWGGEVFAGTWRDLERVGHLGAVPLPGGDAAIRHPARVAIAHLLTAGVELTEDLAPVVALGETQLGVVVRQIEHQVNCVPTTSMGRLFDAVASTLDICHEATFEAQAAIGLEAVASGWPDRPCRYVFDLDDDLVADASPVMQAIVADLREDVPIGAIAAGFHEAVIALIEGWVAHVGLETVALSGGVFQNAYLFTETVGALEASGCTVLTHRLVPANDGGLALGQVLLAGLGAPTMTVEMNQD